MFYGNLLFSVLNNKPYLKVRNVGSCPGLRKLCVSQCVKQLQESWDEIRGLSSVHTFQEHTVRYMCPLS